MIKEYAMKFTYLVSYNQYKTFESYKIDKITRISIGSKFTNNHPIGKINEIFDKEIITDYSTDSRKSPSFDGDDFMFYFKSKSGIEYRIDLLKHEDDKVNYQNMYSILFSLSKNDPYKSRIDDYEELTDKNELIEVLNRIRYIINDWLGKTKYKITFVIGKSDIEKKNRIYKYVVSTCFPDWEIKYDFSSHYFDNKAFYVFKN